MTNLIWKNEYSIGIKDIDEQHKKLVDLVNQLEEIISQDSMDYGKARRKIVLLSSYIRAHFAYEDEWMLRNRHYLGKQDKYVDKEFIQCYESFKKQLLEEMNEEILEIICKSVKQWLVRHLNMNEEAINRSQDTQILDSSDSSFIPQIQRNIFERQQIQEHRSVCHY